VRGGRRKANKKLGPVKGYLFFEFVFDLKAYEKKRNLELMEQISLHICDAYLKAA